MTSETQFPVSPPGQQAHGCRTFVVDVGGTHMRIAEAGENRLLDIEKHPTPLTPDVFYRTMAQGIGSRLVDNSPFVIGISTAGIVNPQTGVVLGSVGNLPALQEAPDLRAKLWLQFQQHPLDIVVENDANAAAYGEAKIGAGQGKSDVVLVILGTGVGAGIVKDGRLYQTRHFTSGEIGHTVICHDPDRDCTLCGKSGCLESYASGPGLLRTAHLHLKHHTTGQSLLLQTPTLTTYELVQAWHAQDPLAIEIMAHWHEHVAQGLYNMIMTLDPETVVLGGGMSQVVDYDLVNRLIRCQTRLAVPDDIRVVPAQLGDDAGLLGVALLARERVQQAV